MECDNQLYLYVDDSTLFCEKSTDDPMAIATIYNYLLYCLNKDLVRIRILTDKWKVTCEPFVSKLMAISRKRNALFVAKSLCIASRIMIVQHLKVQIYGHICSHPGFEWQPI